MKKPGNYIFWSAILLGLFIRYLSLFYNGIFDMETYHNWGLSTLNEGLYNAFQGSYLPFQYQIFELGAYLSLKLNTDYFIVYKLINLFFDAGNLIVLSLIFKRINVSKYYLLIYWLHPWFLLLFSQGYCDFQFTFFVLCSILLAFKGSSRSYLTAGIFLGFAFLMKPQAQVIILALIIYCSYLFIKERDIKPLHLFVFPTILFIDYTLYFFVMTGKSYLLLRHYIDIGSTLPLTANFLNGWFPVAYFLKEPAEAIYSITDDIKFFIIKGRTLAILSLLTLLWLFIRKIYRSNIHNDINYNYFLIAGFATFIFPFIMTSAHENHLFLASVLLIPVLGKVKNLTSKISIHILMVLQCINLYGFYGYGEGKYIKMINISYTYEFAFILSLIATIAFIILLFEFLRPKSDFIVRMKQKVITEK